MNTAEWQKEAESAIASADIENVRLAFFERLTERYGIRNGKFSAGPTEIDFLTEPAENLGISIKDAQRLAAFKYLTDLQEQLSWTRYFFLERLDVAYRGPRPMTAYVDKLLRATLLSALSRPNLDGKRCRLETSSPGVLCPTFQSSNPPTY